MTHFIIIIFLLALHFLHYLVAVHLYSAYIFSASQVSNKRVWINAKNDTGTVKRYINIS